MKRLITILMTITAIGLLASASPVLAQATDYAQCDGLTGPALGLCKAGVSIGCDGDGSHPACVNIEETFEAISGVAPPWAPFSCPCWAGSTVGELTSMVDAWFNTDGNVDIECWLRGAPDKPYDDYAWITVYSHSLVDAAWMWAGIPVDAGPGEVTECGLYGYGGWDPTNDNIHITDEAAENCMAEIDQVIAASPSCQ